jgi:muramoyltetrapeptide carboxypeptidase
MSELNIISPKTLNPGDTIALISPAKAIEAHLVENAKTFFESRGYHVLVGEHAVGQFNYFSGTEEERLSDLQWAIDHPEVKAIICNRGGYGAIHLLQKANFANLLREPRWIAGFSDITNFHCLCYQLGIESIHSTMPLNFEENTAESLETLLSSIGNSSTSFNWEASEFNHEGRTQGIVLGGNLAILYSLLGTKYFPNLENAILFIEDIGEQAYALDRMLYAFQLAGIWDKISGLIVGGMTGISETAVPTKLNFKETITGFLKYRKIPVAFDAPIGHQDDNRAVIVGRKGSLIVDKENVSFSQSN